jgi:hypothetical protein
MRLLTSTEDGFHPVLIRSSYTRIKVGVSPASRIAVQGTADAWLNQSSCDVTHHFIGTTVTSSSAKESICLVLIQVGQLHVSCCRDGKRLLPGLQLLQGELGRSATALPVRPSSSSSSSLFSFSQWTPHTARLSSLPTSCQLKHSKQPWLNNPSDTPKPVFERAYSPTPNHSVLRCRVRSRDGKVHFARLDTSQRSDADGPPLLGRTLGLPCRLRRRIAGFVWWEDSFCDTESRTIWRQTSSDYNRREHICLWVLRTIYQAKWPTADQA